MPSRATLPDQPLRSRGAMMRSLGASLWQEGAPHRRLALNAGLAGAALHRRRRKRVTFIGVTGSCGKTTTTGLIAGVLRSQLPGNRTIGGYNDLTSMGITVLRTRRRHAFCAIEVAAWEPGSVARAARVIHPHIAVVLNVGPDHRTAFRTLEATAREKSALLAATVDGGVAVLNADDPHVMGMADGFPGRVISFGRSSDAELSAREVRAAWPERLSFTLRHDGRSWPVQTRLCGKHWVTSALAALSVALAMEIPLRTAIDALAELEPYPGRMSPVIHRRVTFIRDDIKAPLWTMDSVLEFLAEAQAARKIAVIGTLSDYSGSSSRVYRAVARRALDAADEVVFGGRSAKQALRPERGPWPPALCAFATAQEAGEHVLSTMREGDLVVLKGSVRADQFHRFVPPPDGRGRQAARFLSGAARAW
jgi:UDP-N-acetylmuramoyl-tripeptide--D-alanyl-D-alanine ligase